MIGGVETTMFKPGVFVNLSGPAIERLLARLGGRAEDCIVVLDDMDLPLGSARLRREGGDGGHKGMRSIIGALGTDAIARIKLGVRRAGEVRRAERLVLANFAPDDRALVLAGLAKAEAMLRTWVREKGGLPAEEARSA